MPISDPDPVIAKVVVYDSLCGFLFVNRQILFALLPLLRVPHGLPALPSSPLSCAVFTVLLNCAAFDLVTSTASVRPKIQMQIAAVLIIISVMTILEVQSSGVWRSLDEK